MKFEMWFRMWIGKCDFFFFEIIFAGRSSYLPPAKPAFYWRPPTVHRQWKYVLVGGPHEAAASDYFCWRLPYVDCQQKLNFSSGLSPPAKMLHLHWPLLCGCSKCCQQKPKIVATKDGFCSIVQFQYFLALLGRIY